MHSDLAERLIESVRRRERQGDCPTEPALSVETLEDLVLALARAEPGEAERAIITRIVEGLSDTILARWSCWEQDCQHPRAEHADAVESVLRSAMPRRNPAPPFATPTPEERPDGQ